MLESEKEEAIKIIENQKKVHMQLNEELAAVRRAKQDLEVKWLAQDNLHTDLNNICIKMRKTINLGTDSDTGYIERTEKLVQQATELARKTTLMPRVTKKIARAIEARDEA